MNNNFLRRLRVESLETRILLAADCFQNPINPNDVNGDQVFNMADTRAVFVGLNSDDVAEGEHIQTFNDVNGDGGFNVGDLRSLLNASLSHASQDIHAAIDNAMSAVSQSLNISDLLGAIDDIPNIQLPSEVWSALDDVYSNVHSALDDVADQVSDSLSNASHIINDAFDDLDMALSYGLENSSHILSSVNEQVSQAQQHVQDAIDKILDDVFNGSNGDSSHGDSSNGSSSSPFAPLAGPVADFLDGLGVEDLSGQIESFIDDVNDGTVTLSDDGYYVFDLIADGLDNPASIASLVTADQGRLRQGVIDILDAYEGEGYELPDVAIDLRSDLEAGASLLSIYLNLVTAFSLN